MKRVRLLVVALSLCALGPTCEPEVKHIAFSPDGRTAAFVGGLDIDMLCVAPTDSPGPATAATPVAEVAEPSISWSSDSRWLAYTSDDAGSWDIWVWDAQTKKTSQITQHLAKDHLATFWPGSKVVLFVSTRGRQADIWQVDMEGGEPKQVTDDVDVESDLSVSVDGRCLIYKAADPEGRCKIVARPDPEGRAVSLALPEDTVGQLKVAPNGKALAFAGKKGLYVADLDADGIEKPSLVVKRKGSHAMTFEWSPDSDSLLVSNGGCIVRRGLGWFGREKTLTSPRSHDTVPVWHPDMQHFAYAPDSIAATLAPLRSPDQRHWLVCTPLSGHFAAQYERAKGKLDTALALARVAVDLMAQEKSDSALAISDVHVLYAELLAGQGQVDQALAFCAKRLANDLTPATIQLAFNRDATAARAALAEVSEHSTRRSDIEAALADLTGSALDRFCDALAAELRGDSAAAVEQWLRLAAAAAESPDPEEWAHRAIGRAVGICKNELGESKAPLEPCREWLQKRPEHPAGADLALWLAGQLGQQKKHTATAREYERIASTHPGEPRAKALLALARLYRSELAEPVKALDAADATIAEARQIGADAREELLGAWNEKIDLQVGPLSDLDAALATARALPEMVDKPGDGTTNSSLAAAVDRCARSFDRAHAPDLANEALPGLLRLLQEPDLLEDLLKRQAGHIVRLLTPEPFVKCKLGHLPKWVEARSKVFLSHLEEVTEPGQLTQQRLILQTLGAWRATDVQALLRPLEERWQSGDTSDETRLALTTGYYVLGNFHQTRRELGHALTYYERLVGAMEDDDVRGYAKTLAECREFLPRRPHIVRQWLDLEKSIAYGLWEPVDLVRAAAKHDEKHHVPMADTQWDPIPGYEAFLKKHGKTSLADDAELRLIELSPNSHRRAQRAERFLMGRAGSRVFGRAVEEYATALAGQDMPWFAATFLAGLAKKPDYARHLPVLHTTIGSLYDEHLDRFALAKPHFEIVSHKHPSSSYWPMAEKPLIEGLLRDRKWQSAAPRLHELIGKCPELEWVKEGAATLALGEAWEKLDHWPKAEEAYVTVITQHRDLLEDKGRGLLWRCLDRLTPAALDRIHEAAPGDLRYLLKKLDAERAARLRERYPDLAGP